MVYLRCDFKTMNGNKIKKENPSKRFKNTECLFTLVLKFKRDETKLNCDLEMEWNHNHHWMLCLIKTSIQQQGQNLHFITVDFISLMVMVMIHRLM